MTHLSAYPCSRRGSPTCRHLSRRQRESGTTLIEALVAMLVLSIGLLGIAGLAAASLRNSQGAWARAAVASGLSDFADRVRANPTANETAYRFAANDYAAQREALLDEEVVIAKDCLAEVCTPTQLATYHLTDWRLAMNRSMPGAAVWVTGERDKGYQATVMWFDKTFVDDDGVTPSASATCNGAEDGIAARTCCPDAANAVDGVRCTNMTIVP